MRSRRDTSKTRATSVTKIAALSLLLGLTIGFSSKAHSAEAEGASVGSAFNAHVTKLEGYQRSVDESESEIKKLIEEKREADDEKVVRSLTLEIAEKYKSLREVGVKFEQEATLIRFHFPEQAQKLDRKYVRYTTKSLKDLEGEAGIDGRLDRIHAHVLATFPVPELERAKAEPPKINPLFVRKPASLEDEDVPEKIILSK